MFGWFKGDGPSDSDLVNLVDAAISSGLPEVLAFERQVSMIREELQEMQFNFLDGNSLSTKISRRICELHLFNMEMIENHSAIINYVGRSWDILKTMGHAAESKYKFHYAEFEKLHIEMPEEDRINKLCDLWIFNDVYSQILMAALRKFQESDDSVKSLMNKFQPEKIKNELFVQVESSTESFIHYGLIRMSA